MGCRAHTQGHAEIQTESKRYEENTRGEWGIHDTR